ncbi:MAG TPA: serine--tRNA ligase, partial [Caulobacter sp.]|nr:serine--tRNA ligase [Caulobacter sp.]
MHDIKAIRENRDNYEAAWAAKGKSGEADKAIELDAKLRAAITAREEFQAKRNELSRLYGQARARKDEPEVQRLWSEIQALPDQSVDDVAKYRDELRELLAGLPNIPAPEVPAGEDEHGNVEQRRWGDAKA